jgi:hypothetical protein
MRMNRNILNLSVVLMLFTLGGCSRFSGFGGGDIKPSKGPELLDGGVRFSVYSTDAEKIAIVGSFNNWSKSVDFLSRSDEKGVWEITLPLSAGRYEYKFVIDGKKWIPDPGNINTVNDGFGELNSVVMVR